MDGRAGAVVPHMRGCSAVNRLGRFEQRVVPAHAGLFRCAATSSRLLGNRPCARRAVPEEYTHRGTRRLGRSA